MLNPNTQIRFKLFFSIGNGYLTFKINNVRAYVKVNGNKCDTGPLNYCDPYLILFINNDQVNATKPRASTCCFDAEYTYYSSKIPKTSTIKVQLWDSDEKRLLNNDDLILEAEGTIESFMKSSIRPDGASRIDEKTNLLETTTIWQDELKYIENNDVNNIPTKNCKT